MARRRSSTIEGELPSPTNLPRGCRFASRCPQRMPRCLEIEPALVPTAVNHLVACHLYGDEHNADTTLQYRGGSE
jgi:oligopeptide/dipeptide ABC transporter ATP-binding protein